MFACIYLSAQSQLLPDRQSFLSAVLHRFKTSFVYAWTLPACLHVLFHFQVDHCRLGL